MYVLANSAMPGLVKIGKTTRSTSERATELSAATGLPTPFIVVYEQLFGDCSAAEAFVHTCLADQGYRVTDNREFFNAPVNDVVRAIVLAPGAIVAGVQHQETREEDELLSAEQDDELASMSLSEPVAQDLPPWHSVFEAAEDIYWGVGDCIQDYDEALRLYRQAAKLGCVQAYSRIGEMYEHGEAVRQDKKVALDYYKEGARKGGVYCYWRMGMLFEESNHRENASKCFSLFVKNLPPSVPDDVKLTYFEYTCVARDLITPLSKHVIDGISFPEFLTGYVSQHRSKITTVSGLNFGRSR